jgi:CubicO group peptidase (beta-lactamase class C family)
MEALVEKRGRHSLFMIAVVIATAACGSRDAARKPSVQTPTQAPPRAQLVADLVGAYHERGHFDGAVLVADGGRIVYQGAFGLANREWNVPHSPDSRFEIASMTKPMTAIVILQLVDEGRIRLDAAVADYVPHFKTAAGAKITIEQLLTHRSGLQQDIAFADDDDPNGAGVAARINADQLPLDEMVRLIAARPLRFPPGTDFAYSSDGYAVLGAVIERVSGQGYWDALDERVFRRAGMTSTVPAVLRPLVRNRVMGYQQTWGSIENGAHIGASPAGGLYATVNDLFAWERGLAGDKLLSPRMKELVFAARDAITAYGWKTRKETRRGRQVLVARTTGGLPGFVHVLERIPAEDRVVIVLCNLRGPAYQLDHLVKGIHQTLDGGNPELPRRSAAISAAALLGQGAEAVGRELERMAGDVANYYVDEGEINSLGYHALLGRRDAPAAVAVLAFNASRYPKSPNVYDSLGEAQLAAGDRDAAILSYQKVLELDPKNANARKVLLGLGAAPKERALTPR